jgi:hypothetical protein
VLFVVKRFLNHGMHGMHGWDANTRIQEPQNSSSFRVFRAFCGQKIFLKMADEYGRQPYRRDVGVPKKYA